MSLLSAQLSPGAFMAPAVDWLNTNWHPFFAGITVVIEFILNTIIAVLLFLPAYGLIAVAFALAFFLIGWRAAILTGLTLGFCWAAGLWPETMATVTLVCISVFFAVMVAFPIGVLAARHRHLEAAIRPLLDIMQTVPPWVYLIPAVIIFTLGSVPAIIATIVYAIPPMLRITTLAFKQIPTDLQELGAASGAHPSAILFKIEIPAAKPTLLVGLNQCILLALAMVVLAGLVGAGGLGASVTQGLTRMDMGLGLRSGLAIVAIAMLLDGLSKAVVNRSPKGRAQH